MKLVLCLDDGGYTDLEPGKVYRVCHDPQTGRQGLLRVIDESGEDYLYPGHLFLPWLVAQAGCRIGR